MIQSFGRTGLAILACVVALAAACSPPSDAQWTLCSANATNYAARAQACTTVIARRDAHAGSAYYYRGLAFAHLQRDEDAIADFTQTINIYANSANTYFNRAEAFERLGRYDEAIADFDRALRINPTDATFLNDACWVRAVAGKDLERAAELCEGAITHDERNANFRDSRAVVRLKQQDYQGALDDYEVAVRMDPRSGRFAYGRGIALVRVGREAEGRAALAAAATLDPEAADAFAILGVTP